MRDKTVADRDRALLFEGEFVAFDELVVPHFRDCGYPYILHITHS